VSSFTESGDWLLRPRRRTAYRLRPVALILIPVAAILFQVYVPLFFSYLSYLDMPLLVTVYFSLMRREPIAGVLIGASIGLLQDSLSHNPIGMFGIVKTLVGFFAATASQRFDVQNVPVRFLLGFFFFFFHQFFYWMLTSSLLGQQVGFDLAQTIVFGLLNSAVAVPLFQVLDKL
jgi:rod shape-determining protein MreD